ncbi:MAG: hypothetical protein JWO38_2430 [Gemmataceae bacterium]|nr:hypothetical protein [Gemmataceae bacterium]
MLRPVLIVGALAVLVAAGVVEGRRSNRWGVSEDLRASAGKLTYIPPAFGAWTSTETEMDPKILDKAEAVGAVARVYQNKTTGATLSVLILCGPSGPIGAHTPDVCYAGLGYQMTGREVRKPIPLADGSAPVFWSGRFEKGNGEPGLLVAWAWGADGDWVASEAPRREFVLRSVLFKLYVSRGLTAAEQAGRPGPDPTQEFLTDFLPEVKKALAPTPG